MRMWRFTPVFFLIIGLSIGASRPQDPFKGQPLNKVFRDKIRLLMGKYCYKCHGPQLRPKADLNLTRYQTELKVRQRRKLFKEVVTKLQTLEMPPEKAKQPSAQERLLMVQWITAALNKVDRSAKKTPGRVVARRLNRTEYRNTVKDLLGVDYPGVENFPSDDLGYGFDNIGDVLSLPPLLMENYLVAADRIMDQVVANNDSKLVFIARPTGEQDKRDAARKVLEHVASRAFRRPVLAAEVAKMLKLFDEAAKQEDSFEKAMKLPLLSTLISPHFIFRIEPNARPGGSIAPLNGFEIASRLSYFLWSTMPDAELTAAAKQGRLKDPKDLESQVRRMLKHPKASEFARNFTPQWLQVRRLEEMQFDRGKFSGYNEQLRDAMIQETVLFFQAIMKEDRSVLEFLDADFTFVNGALARHYGISGGGAGFQRVKLTDPRRGGILTMAAVLASTSDPNRTSPVKRGKWVLEAVLNQPPPPPIPSAANLRSRPDDRSLTLRQRMERHRQDPNCAPCHNRMDPIGFGLENYNAVGAWRTNDDGKPLDTKAKLPSGESFSGPVELKAILKKRKKEFVEALTTKMMTYALGRGPEPSDVLIIEEIAANVAKDGYTFSTLVLEIAKSYPFRYRQRDMRRRR